MDSRASVWLRPGREVSSRSRIQALEALLLVGIGIATLRTAGQNPLQLGLGWLMAAGGLDALMGLARARWKPALELRGARLCRGRDCRDLGAVRGVALSWYDPYLLRPDLLAELRIVLDWGGDRWIVPLTHDNWDVLWEALREKRPKMLPWWCSEAVLEALAQTHEVPYHVPPQVSTDVEDPPKWVLWLSGGVAFLAGLVLNDFTTARWGTAIPDPAVYGVSGLVALFANRKFKKIRVAVRPRRERAP